MRATHTKYPEGEREREREREGVRDWSRSLLYSLLFDYVLLKSLLKGNASPCFSQNSLRQFLLRYSGK
jgi:hypothetical protein